MTSESEYSAGRVFPSLPRTTRGQPIVVGSSPKGDQIIYCAGNSVFTIDVADMTCSDIYTEHSHPTTVCKMAPSGFYNASADSVGNVRLWDTTQKTHILKNQFQLISGPIRDLCWSDDSKRLAAVGEGRERFGHAILFDTGTSNGDLSGQSRPVSTIDIRPVRPYRLVTGSEDNTVAIFEGPPFKFKTLFHEHTRFVWVTRYAPDGQLFASAGADGKIVLFEGTAGEKQGELVDEKCKGAAHGGSVFGLAWSPCGKQIASASGDKTVKIWDVASRALVHTITFGNAVEDQQLSITWTAKALISVNLAGFLQIIDAQEGKVTKVVKGHNKPITAVALSHDNSSLFTADFEGNVTRFTLASGESERMQPNIHKTQISGMCVASDGTLITVAYDDTLQFSKGAVENAQVRPTSVKLSSQPLGVASNKDGSLVATAGNKSVCVFKNGQQCCESKNNYVATCVTLCESKNLVAVGGNDNNVHIYSITASSISESKVLNHTSAITSIAFSPDGEHLAVTDAGRKVAAYAVGKDFARANDKEWTFHAGRPNCVAWSPDSRRLATGAIDTNIIVWDLDKSGEHPIIIKAAHAMNPVNGIVWLSTNTLISVGQDANVKTWHLQ